MSHTNSSIKKALSYVSCRLATKLLNSEVLRCAYNAEHLIQQETRKLVQAEFLIFGFQVHSTLTEV